MPDTILLNQILEITAKNSGGVTALVSAYYCKDIINEVGKRMLTPSADSIGNLLKNVIDLTTFQHPVSQQIATKIYHATCKIFEKLKNYNSDDFVSQISPEIAVPILNKLSYFDEGDLRELLINLLATSMLKEGQVHPSIVSIVDRLSSGEAKILSLLCESEDWGPWPFLTIKAAQGKRVDDYKIPDLETFDISSESDVERLYGDIFGEKGRDVTGFIDIGGQYLATLGKNDHLNDFESTNFCVSNLKALGLIEVTSGYIKDKVQYVQLLLDSKEIIKKALRTTKQTPICELGKLSITPLGSKIIKTFSGLGVVE